MHYNLKLWLLFFFLYSINGQTSDPYLSQCKLQQTNNTYVNNCNRSQELSVVRSYYENVDFLCVILDNRNGRYSNQIIQIEISKRNNYRIVSKSATEVKKNQYKIYEAKIVIFAIHSKKIAGNELPKIGSIRMGEIELCDSNESFQNNITKRSRILRRIPRAIIPIKECTVPAREIVLTVSNGEKVPDRYYPWHVSIFRIKDSSSSFICGGSIISNEHVLTAAHCLYEERRLVINSRLFIRVGSNNRERGDYYGIYKKIVHRDFNFDTFKSDIALLQTQTEIEYSRTIKPVCFTAIDFRYANMDAWIPGWGLTENQTAGLTEDLNHVNMPGRTNADCEERNPKFFKDYVNDKNFCAGNLNTTSICRGDSGGGLVMQRNDGWYIRGIASFTPSSKSGSLDVCDLSQFAVFTDVVQFAEWINQNMQKTIVLNSEVLIKRPVAVEPVRLPTPTVPLGSDGTCGERPNSELKPFNNILAVRSYPWHAGVYEFADNGIVQYRCGGTLINENTVITAGHCVSEFNQSINKIIVKLGTVNLNTLGEFGKDYNVGKLKVHDSHNNENFQHDIALLRLKTIVEFTSYIVPACYSNEDFDYIDQQGKVAGWGLSRNEGLSEYLQYSTMTGKSEQFCKETYPNFKLYLNTKYNFCAGNLKRPSVCRGFSGGGLVFQRNNKWVLRGILSISPLGDDIIDSCDTSTKYVIFTDIVKHYDWIHSSIIEFNTAV